MYRKGRKRVSVDIESVESGLKQSQKLKGVHFNIYEKAEIERVTEI